MNRPVCPGSADGTTSSPSQAHAELADSTLARRPIEEALAFLDEVKAQFHYQPEVYTTFLNLLKDYKEERIEYSTLIDHATALFANYPQLIRRLKVLMPVDYCPEGRTLHPPPPPHAHAHAHAPGNREPPFNAAMDYVNRIKMRFADEPDIYKNFLDVLQTYQIGGQSDSNAVLTQITLLFRGHEDLVEEFKKFVNSDCDCCQR